MSRNTFLVVIVLWTAAQSIAMIVGINAVLNWKDAQLIQSLKEPRP